MASGGQSRILSNNELVSPRGAFTDNLQQLTCMRYPCDPPYLQELFVESTSRSTSESSQPLLASSPDLSAAAAAPLPLPPAPSPFLPPWITSLPLSVFTCSFKVSLKMMCIIGNREDLESSALCSGRDSSLRVRTVCMVVLSNICSMPCVENYIPTIHLH